MRFIKRLFGKQQAATTEIDFHELQPWLEGLCEKTHADVCGHAASIYSDIADLLNEMEESIELLKEAKAEGTFHLKLVKVARSNRDIMVKQVKTLRENIIIPETTDLPTILLFHEKAMLNLNVCLENMMKSHRYVKMVYIEESKPVVADAVNLRKLLDMLVEPISSKKSVIDAFERSNDAINAINDATSGIEIEIKAVAKKDEDIAHLNEEIQEKQNAISILVDSEEWKQYLDSKNELKKLEDDAEKAELDIRAIISPINSVINRLKNLNDAGKYTLNPEIKQELSTCLSDPKNSSAEFYIEVKKIVESEILGLKPERHNKMLKHLEVIISSLDGYKKHYNDLISELAKKKDEISNINLHREEMSISRDLRALQDKLSGLEQEVAVSKKQITALKDSVEVNKHQLQQSVSVIDSRMKISYAD